MQLRLLILEIVEMGVPVCVRVDHHVARYVAAISFAMKTRPTVIVLLMIPESAELLHH